MAAIHGVRADEAIPYISQTQKDDPEDELVTWQVKFLTVREYADIQDELFKSSGMGKKREEKFLLGKQAMLALRKGLVGWKNFNYSDKTPVEWEDPNRGRDAADRDRIMDSNLNKIPPEIRNELADYIRGESRLGED